jgi:hypothetical protein
MNLNGYCQQQVYMALNIKYKPLKIYWIVDLKCNNNHTDSRGNRLWWWGLKQIGKLKNESKTSKSKGDKNIWKFWAKPYPAVSFPNHDMVQTVRGNGQSAFFSEGPVADIWDDFIVSSIGLDDGICKVVSTCDKIGQRVVCTATSYNWIVLVCQSVNLQSALLFGSVWFQTKCGNYHPNAVTTIVAPRGRCNSGAMTELHQVQLMSQLRQPNSATLLLALLLQPLPSFMFVFCSVCVWAYAYAYPTLSLQPLPSYVLFVMCPRASPAFTILEWASISQACALASDNSFSFYILINRWY